MAKSTKEKLNTHTRKWFKKHLGNVFLLIKKDKSKAIIRLENDAQAEAHYKYQWQPFFNRYSLNLNLNVG